MPTPICSAEGVPAHKIECIGNIMIDSFEMLRPQIVAADMRQRLRLHAPFAVVTLHRPSNVDEPGKLAELVQALVAVSHQLTVVFSIHPRTRKRLEEFGLLDTISNTPTIRATEPLSYIEFMNLVMGCTIAITDSGGVQEETTTWDSLCDAAREHRAPDHAHARPTGTRSRHCSNGRSAGPRAGRWPA